MVIRPMITSCSRAIHKLQLTTENFLYELHKAHSMTPGETWAGAGTTSSALHTTRLTSRHAQVGFMHMAVVRDLTLTVQVGTMMQMMFAGVGSWTTLGLRNASTRR